MPKKTRSPGASRQGFKRLFSPALSLMLRCRFSVKANIISAAFLIPIVVLLNSFWQTKRELIETTRVERLGAEYAAKLLPVLRLAQANRDAALRQSAKMPVDGASSPAALNEAIKALKRIDAEHGARFETAGALGQAEQAKGSLPSGNESLFKLYAAHAKHVAAWVQLLGNVADASGLVLDPDLDSYFTMDASLLVLPDLIENISKMGSLSAASSAAGQGAEIAAQELARMDALIEHFEGKLIDDAAKVAKARPDLAAGLALGELPQLLAKFRDLATDSPGSGGIEQAQKVASSADALLARLWSVQGSYCKLLATMLESREAALHGRLMGTLTLVSAFILLAAYLFYAFSLAMNSGMRAVTRKVVAVADGDLSTVVKVRGSDELSQVLLHLREMQQRLSGTLGKVQRSADQVASASQQLTMGTSDLANRTEQTSAQLQKTASSMEQMQATVSSTASTTREAAALAERNATVASRGGEVIGEVVTTMQRIQASANTINDIIGLIDSIAFQTNILALNAAVEAARAGEQGKGFAVVASEVRNLAQRSANAAKEIKSLIGVSVEQTESGVRVVRQAGATMEEIVSAAGRINQLLADIARATAEQSTGISMVTEAVGQLDQMTQQNAALVEETLAASNTMMEQAAGLATEVGSFKLPGEEQQRPLGSAPIDFF
ncbi:methyl-accepting chemotaxis protein [Paucibacter sp. APW11]|uniref:Methyl-accepting chemotaxis protein n=1 Tax=Roseateles aquae TaxID=3077235 RepID=A0ABU3PFM1_9BURK|nr:methyl-accepting chemotaxis protein [Paucibacter sp. APW11]MDT9001386.1 methyl-accepting chemotaxis protein [Paucibacter sp. APW11]